VDCGTFAAFVGKKRVPGVAKGEMGALAVAPYARRRMAPVAPRNFGTDTPSQVWIDALRAAGAERDEALAALHGLMLRAARFELRRRNAADADDLATQAADDALVAILSKLDDFRGASRFTTWAYKFALLEAGVRARRRAWQGREVPVETGVWAAFADAGPSAHDRLIEADTLAALRDGVENRLTDHQRNVFCALALNDVPIDVLAERLDTTRGALYKTLHDARKRLREHLSQGGHA
jgi:RNA polymerase sigma-70 factor, ECF subfamily